MPYVRIPPESLEHISLFDYDLVKDEGEFAWYRCPRGRIRVEKADPRVWVENEADGIQLNAKAILIDDGA